MKGLPLNELRAAPPNVLYREIMSLRARVRELEARLERQAEARDRTRARRAAIAGAAREQKQRVQDLKKGPESHES